MPLVVMLAITKGFFWLSLFSRCFDTLNLFPCKKLSYNSFHLYDAPSSIPILRDGNLLVGPEERRI